MRNAAIVSRRELEAHARYVTGVTASTPKYAEADQTGNKEFLVDVYLGDPTSTNPGVIRDVPIASFAKELVSEVRTPVTLERSRQGKYTVVGRAKTMLAGSQGPDGSILEPTYHEVEYNLAELGLLFVADLDYTLEAWGDKVWGDGGPWQAVSAIDAFGAQVVGNGADVPPAIDPMRQTTTTTRHVLMMRRAWGTGGDSFRWGTDPWGADMQKILENVA